MDSDLTIKEPIGVFCLPVDSIQQGYKSIGLKIPKAFGTFEISDHASLFVHIPRKAQIQERDICCQQ